MTSHAARYIEDSREYKIHKDDEKNRRHHGRRRRAADLFGARSRREPFLTSHARDHESEYDTLHEPCNDVAHEKRVTRGGEICPERVVGADDSKHASTENSHEIGPYGQARQH